MSLKQSLREKRLKSVYKTNTKLQLSSKLKQDNFMVRNRNPSISSVNNSKIRKIRSKVLSLANDTEESSHFKFSNLLSTRTSKKIHLSMLSPTNNNVLLTNRMRNIDSFSMPTKKALTFPMPSELLVEKIKDQLTEDEVFEMLGYNFIYFFVPSNNRIICDKNLLNSGFDSETGDYKIIIGDHIDFRYEILAVLGKGSFGQVCKCLDHKSKEIVAVKIIKNKRKFHKQGMIEIKILKLLRDEDPKDCYNIVKIKGHFVFRSHICIVFELLSSSLYDLLKQNRFQGLPLPIVSRFAIQILIALQLSWSLNIIHCDLKPENILLRSPNKCGLKIIDFGSGCFENERVYTYIQSRFYRAPEIMLGIPYTKSIDMWSFACILVELYIGFPLFPGEDESEQFLRIVEILGSPPLSLLEKASRKNVFFDVSNKPKIVPNSRGKIRYPGGKNLQDVVGDEDLLFVEFINDILQWNPEVRPCPSDALNHPWVLKAINFESKKKKNNSSHGVIGYENDF